MLVAGHPRKAAISDESRPEVAPTLIAYLPSRTEQRNAKPPGAALDHVRRRCGRSARERKQAPPA
jgi:hypothetical protein